ncbi:polymeric immunoglobulin receptor [Mugil cephalus]|uniref:polymeric immunoglobulin receptor n=1 Tax=Mugil cephalus TaxID=48193 RepID=UPI001FB76D8E|nr:polymeric immunoglobulin receptor [Mugil cephalus]
MSQLFMLTLLLPWIPAILCKVTTVKEFAVLEGESITVPCHYEPQYASNVKYWCQGSTREFCSSLARTDSPRLINSTKNKVSIFDDPVQQVFTVTMSNVKAGDAGWYMCGVEIGGMWNADDATFTHIKVTQGMSIVNSRVSGEEGSSVTVECLYSEGHRKSEKKWCRSGDLSSCKVTGSEGSYEDTSLTISDDRNKAFTVTLKDLHMRDTGWYWCSAGQDKIPVNVLVTPRRTTSSVPVTSATTVTQSIVYLLTPKSIIQQTWNSHSHMLEAMVVCSSLVLLTGLTILARKLWKLHNKDPMLRQVKLMKEHSEDVGSTVVFVNRDSQVVF